MPVLVSQELEELLVQVLRQYSPNAQADVTPLIPVHDTATYDPSTSTLPSLRDAACEEENLRYWIITALSQWEGQDKAMDELADVLLLLNKLFIQTEFQLMDMNDRPSDLPTRTFLPLHEISTRDSEDLHRDRRDLLLFRQWVLPTTPPASKDWRKKTAHEHGSGHVHAFFSGDDIVYPFPNEYFWNEGDEGSWDNSEDGVPEWREPTRIFGTRNTPAEQFYDPNGLRQPRDPDEVRPSFYGTEIYGNKLGFIE